MVETFSFAHLAYLVFESVLQVVIIALAGFWSASSGLLPKQSQKIISLLNVDLLHHVLFLVSWPNPCPWPKSLK